MVTGENSLVVSVETAGEMLGISRGLAYQLAGQNKLPGIIRLGRRMVVSRKALESVLSGGSQPTTEQQGS